MSELDALAAGGVVELSEEEDFESDEDFESFESESFESEAVFDDSDEDFLA